jgi:hypothetical protein
MGRTGLLVFVPKDDNMPAQILHDVLDKMNKKYKIFDSFYITMKRNFLGHLVGHVEFVLKHDKMNVMDVYNALQKMNAESNLLDTWYVALKR